MKSTVILYQYLCIRFFGISQFRTLHFSTGPIQRFPLHIPPFTSDSVFAEEAYVALPMCPALV